MMYGNENGTPKFHSVANINAPAPSIVIIIVYGFQL
jgi:hypothetical protein